MFLWGVRPHISSLCEHPDAWGCLWCVGSVSRYGSCSIQQDIGLVSLLTRPGLLCQIMYTAHVICWTCGGWIVPWSERSVLTSCSFLVLKYQQAFNILNTFYFNFTQGSFICIAHSTNRHYYYIKYLDDKSSMIFFSNLSRTISIIMDLAPWCEKDYLLPSKMRHPVLWKTEMRDVRDVFLTVGTKAFGYMPVIGRL